MIRKLALSCLCGALPLAISAQIVMDAHPHVSTPAEQKEATVMSLALGGTPGWNPAALRQMLAGANWASDRLHLPTPHPIRASDLVYKIIGPPGVSVAENSLRDDFDNPNVPRETRLRALKFGASGTIDTTNFHFGFAGGRIFNILRLDAPWTERYALRLDQLLGKPSIISDAQAHELALQWLAALDIDVTRLKWTVDQSQYRPHGATNTVLLPIYHVRFGTIHYAASGNLPAFDEPQVQVEILGTTKELQEIKVDWEALSVCHAPLLLMPGALALTPHDEWIKQLQRFQLIPSAPALTPTTNTLSKQFAKLPNVQTNSAVPHTNTLPVGSDF